MAEIARELKLTRKTIYAVKKRHLLYVNRQQEQRRMSQAWMEMNRDKGEEC
ncbi:hypothetical protein [Enterococcus sp. DIV0421]|uniref:hypothetical protein n=1 Tax=Enterococcus sp. DIV0421 TaxID=2774688 RepID=UPI003F688F9F